MPNPRTHEKEIIAWAKGFQIQQRVTVGSYDNPCHSWIDDPSPKWDAHSVYRVSPKQYLVGKNFYEAQLMDITNSKWDTFSPIQQEQFEESGQRFLLLRKSLKE